MTQNITFNQILENEKPIFFHYLDGLLDPNIGDIYGNSTKFILSNLIQCPTFQKNEINFLSTKINSLLNRPSDILSNGISELVFISNKSNKLIINNFDLNFLEDSLKNLSMTENLIKITRSSDEKLGILLYKFNYCIYQIENNEHATSILFFQYNNSQYVLSFNSGLGIDNTHEKIKIGDVYYYSPFFGYCLSENISENKLDCLTKIITIMLIPELYKLLNNPNILKTTIYDLDKNKDKNILNMTLIINIIKYISKINNIDLNELNADAKLSVNIKEKITNYNLFKIKNTVQEKFYQLNYVTKSSNTLRHFLNKQDITIEKSKTFYYLEGEVIHTEIIIFYEFFKKIMDFLELKPFNYSDVGLSDLNLYKPSDLNEFRISMNYIKDQIINKLVLHEFNKNIYILSQDSGSCTWFSNYWTIVMSPIFISKNPTDYKNLINEINSLMVCKIRKAFTIDNFKSTYTNYPDSIILMKNLCQKFINIGLLDKNILEKQMDIIWDLKFNYKYIKINLLNKQSELDFVNPFMKNVKNIFKSSKIIQNLINFILFYFSDNDIIHHNSLALLVYILFKTKPNLFRNSKVTLNTKLANISVSPSKIIKIFIESIGFPKTKSNKQSIINYIDDDENLLPPEFKLLNSLIDEYNQIISHVNSKSENKPSYYIDYYQYAKYIIQYFNQLDMNKLLEIKIKKLKSIDSNTIYSFVEYMCKFNIMLKIISCFNTILKNDLFKNTSIQLSKKLGNHLYNDILLKIINYDKFDFKEELIRDKDLTVLNFDNFNSFIFKNGYTKGIITETSFKLYEINWEKYLQLIRELLQNPSIENQGLNLDSQINFSQFIKLFIFDIFENESIRDNLIYYYCNKIWDEPKNEETIINNLVNIQLLLTKSVGILPFTLEKYQKLSNYYLLNYDINIYSIEDVKSIMTELIKTYKTKESFCNYVIKNKDTLLDDEEKIVKIIKTHFSNVTLEDNKFKIEDTKYRLISFNNDLFKKLFLIEPFGQILISKPILLNNFNILVIYRQYFMKFNCELDSDKFIINKIYFNKQEIIKYSIIPLPFKYFLPPNCLHFIYKEDNIFKVTYFINPELNIKTNEYTSLNLLGKDTMAKQVLTFEINDANFFLKITNQNILPIMDLINNYGINSFNSLFSSFNKEPIDIAFYLNDKMGSFLPNKIQLAKKQLTIKNLEKVNLLTENDDNILSIQIIDENHSNGLYGDELKSYEKLLFKISKCTINSSNIELFKCKLKKLNDQIMEKNNRLSQQISSINNLDNLIDKYDYIYSLILNSRLLNSILSLEQILKSDDISILCDQSKIYSDLFNLRKSHFKYGIEILFELLAGFIISDEQFNRYVDIINSFIEHENKYNDTRLEPYTKVPIKWSNEINVIDIKYIKKLIGGSDFNYPLHHFMMGKGKSTVITPLVALHLTIIYNKIVYIIVPIHLLEQTTNIIGPYIKLFELDNKIKIVSDIEIKMEFLEGKFNKDPTKYVFLIDEFDTILDPIKSNFNLTIKKDTKVENIYQLIRHIVLIIKTKRQKQIILEDLEGNYFGFNRETTHLIINDINKIILDLDSGTLIENINWGINPDSCWAIPYLNKDKPMKNSNFSSSIITIFLTMFHYIIDLNFKLDKFMYNYIISNNLASKFLHINIQNQYYSMEDIDNLLDKQGRENIFELILNDIFSKLLLSTYQYNTSFVDIINIDKLFKVGYSGTMNVQLPSLKANNFNASQIIKDYDESLNIKYSINKSTLVSINSLDILKNQSNQDLLRNFFDSNLILNYQAIIDTYGLFKNIDNKEIAINIYNKFKENDINIDVIFLNEFDHKHVYSNDILTDYTPSKNYLNPFLYYSQTHIVGIDIKQDKYPKLKGLCIIDSKSTYSIVAQSMFRLRKLNQGHSIDFLFINKPTNITSKELYSYLLCNEYSNQYNKIDYLNYQTIKSEIRKRRYQNKIEPVFKDNFKEKVKHYYLESIPSIEQIDKIFEEIITKDEIETNELDELFGLINNQKTLLKLVYKINSLACEQEQEQEKEKLKQIEITKSPDLNIVPFSINYGFNDKLIDWSKFCTDSYLNKYAIRINDLISYLPNIYCAYDLYNYYPNYTSIIYVYIIPIGKVLVIPGYMLGYFINEYPVFNYKLEIFNRIKFDDISFIERIKTNIIFDIYNSGVKTYNIETIEPELLLLLYFGSLSSQNPSYIVSQIRILFLENYTTQELTKITINSNLVSVVEIIKKKMTIDMVQVCIERKNKQKVSLDLIPIRTKYLHLDQFYIKKYLLYKAKYLALKNKK